MRGYLTKQHDGLYMFTKKLPIKCKIDGTDIEAVYIAPGDSIGIKDICSLAKIVFKIRRELEPLESVEVSFEGNIKL